MSERLRLSDQEIRDLIISSLVLGFILHLFIGLKTNNWVVNFLVSSLIAFVSFIPHELAHKYLALRYQHEARYRFLPMLAVVSLFISLLTWFSGSGVMMLVVGEVVLSAKYGMRIGFRYPYMSTEENGKIAAAGPLVNLLIYIFLKLISFNPLIDRIADFNLYLALFNSLPLPSFDGNKILTWSIIPWSALMSVELMFLLFSELVPFFFLVLASIIICVFLFLWLQKYTKVRL